MARRHAGPQSHRPSRGGSPELARWGRGPGTVSKSRKGGKRHVAPQQRITSRSFGMFGGARRTARINVGRRYR